jgi:hypothetical protein
VESRQVVRMLNVYSSKTVYKGWCGGGWEPATVMRIRSSDWLEKMAVPETRQSGNSGTAVLLAQGTVFIGDMTTVRCRQVLGRTGREH